MIKSYPRIIQSFCESTFLAPDPDGKRYEFNMVARKHVEGYPPLELVHSQFTVFPYPPPKIEYFSGSPQLGEIMYFDIYYPYSFGISLVAFMMSFPGGEQFQGQFPINLSLSIRMLQTYILGSDTLSTVEMLQ